MNENENGNNETWPKIYEDNKLKLRQLPLSSKK